MGCILLEDTEGKIDCAWVQQQNKLHQFNSTIERMGSRVQSRIPQIQFYIGEFTVYVHKIDMVAEAIFWAYCSIECMTWLYWQWWWNYEWRTWIGVQHSSYQCSEESFNLEDWWRIRAHNLQNRSRGENINTTYLDTILSCLNMLVFLYRFIYYVIESFHIIRLHNNHFELQPWLPMGVRVKLICWLCLKKTKYLRLKMFSFFYWRLA